METLALIAVGAAYLSLLFELLFIAVPSEASALALIRGGGAAGPPPPEGDALARMLAAPILQRVIGGVLPTIACVVFFVLPIVLWIRPAWYGRLVPLAPALSVPGVMAALPLLAGGRVLTITAMHRLRRARRADPKQLVTTGVFGVSRNPGLVGMGAFYLGLVALHPCLVLGAGFAIYAWNMHRKVLLEESRLGRIDAAAFAAYAQAVPRYFGRCRAVPSRKASESQAEVTAWFDTVYRDQGEGYLRPAAAYPVFLDLLEVARGTRFLDVGSGLGRLLVPAAERGARATGVDVSMVALRRTRAKLPVVPLVVANAEALPFADASFDRVSAIGVIERLLDAGRALAEMRRVAATGARFCFMVRNARTLGWLSHRLMSGRRNDASHAGAKGLTSWTTFFENEGFEVLAIHGDPWPRERWLRWLGLARRGRSASRPRRPLVPLRFANEFIFVLAERAGRAEQGSR